LDLGYIRKLIDESDIFGISETWMNRNMDLSFENNFVVEKIAEKKKKKGRASGGFLIFFHKKFKNMVTIIEKKMFRQKMKCFGFCWS